ncbi:hypothetical protein MRX96_043133 [Rhipicephalus microplus]
MAETARKVRFCEYSVQFGVWSLENLLLLLIMQSRSQGFAAVSTSPLRRPQHGPPCGDETQYPLATDGGSVGSCPKTKGQPRRRRLHSLPPAVDLCEFRISRRPKNPAQMMAARRRGTVPTAVLTFVLLSLTQLAHLASTEVNTNPPEPSDVVDGPLPDEFEVPETSSIHSDDTALTTQSDTNDESNEIHAADGLGVHGEVLSLSLQNDAGVATEYLVGPNSLRPSRLPPYEPRNLPKQYQPLHESYRYPHRPFTVARTFLCNFDEHACGMRNQKNIGAHFKLVSGSIAGREGRYMAVDSQLVPAGVSRLITPYLPGYPNAMVCLQLKYFVHGPGAERIQIVAQDIGNRPLFSLERHETPRLDDVRSQHDRASGLAVLHRGLHERPAWSDCHRRFHVQFRHVPPLNPSVPVMRSFHLDSAWEPRDSGDSRQGLCSNPDFLVQRKGLFI